MPMASPFPLSLDTLFSPNRPSFSLLLPSPKPTHSHSLAPTSTSTSTFLDPTSIYRLQTLKNFQFSRQFPHGSLRIRPMEPAEAGAASDLLADSFGETMPFPDGYSRLLAFLVKQYVIERSELLPHAVMLVGFYTDRNGEDEEEEEEQLACTAEVSLDARGASATPPTPTAPRNCPYICNMTVKKSLRRRGIGRELLKACEELISQMKTIRKVYLHCRMIDTVPFGMYKKSGYRTVKTDSILVWFTLQRRKYLMCKNLPPPPPENLAETSDSGSDDTN